MAAVRTSSYRNQNRAGRRQMYVYGNTVTKPEVMPKRAPEREPAAKTRTSRQIRRNRNRALSLTSAYAAFLAAAAVCVIMVCMVYLKLQSDIVSRSEHITQLQEELATLTEENDSAYQAAEDSINLETIRSRAVNELGMVYAAQGRIVEYEKPAVNHVKQYNDIPEDGVLAKSRNVSE